MAFCPAIIEYAFACVAGACVFSFLNVLIYRLPRHIDFIRGRSFCPACGHALAAPDLVPVLSWLLLRGRCRYCGGRIPLRDTLTELLGATLAALCVLTLGFTGRALLLFALLCVLDVVTFVDIDTMEIPDGCHVAVILLAAGACFLFPETALWQRLLGGVCVSVPMLLLTLFIPNAFGGGDMKLMAALGLFLGWRLTLLAAFIGVVLGGVRGALLLAKKREKGGTLMAFGPYLCAGGAAAALFGEPLLRWYLSFFP